MEYEFYGGTPPHQESETSLAAAEAIRPKAGSKRLEVLQLLEFKGPYGATDEEIALALGKDRSCTIPRRRELEIGGWVVDSGMTRLTRCKHKSIVWVARGVPVEPFQKKKKPSQIIAELNIANMSLGAENRDLKNTVESLRKQLSFARRNQCQCKKI